MKYENIDISETELEELIRQNPGNIEAGLRFIDHQRKVGRGPYDVLLVDSGKALVVAELKIDEDDDMLFQGIDYYDYIASNIEGLSRAYSKYDIDPLQEPRLLLIAPTFSSLLINRCKWLSIQISLFTFQCIELDEKKGEVIAIFKDMEVPAIQERIEIPTIDEHLDYITDSDIRKQAELFLEQIRHWDEDKIATEAIKWEISLKVAGRLFGYFGPRRKYFVISTWDEDDKWKTFPIKNEEDMKNAADILKHNMEWVKKNYEII